METKSSLYRLLIWIATLRLGTNYKKLSCFYKLIPWDLYIILNCVVLQRIKFLLAVTSCEWCDYALTESVSTFLKIVKISSFVSIPGGGYLLQISPCIIYPLYTVDIAYLKASSVLYCVDPVLVNAFC